MDVFTWSIPFVIEKVTEILLKTVDNSVTAMEAEEVKAPQPEAEAEDIDIMKRLEEDVEPSALSSRPDVQRLRKKIRTMSRMLVMLKTIREEKESLTKIKGMSPDGMIPRGLILEGRDAIKDALDQFTKAKEIDKKNEAMPGTDAGN